MDEKQTQEPVQDAMAQAPAAECAQCETYLAGWRRAQADYHNLKRETDREKLEFSKFANERLLAALLPAIDQFEMALAYAPDFAAVPEPDRKKCENWLVGIKAVRAGWESAFKEIGLEQVPTAGPFDPLMHEAIGEEAAAGVPSGQVIRCVQSGWRLNGKLLRPAKVQIAT